MKSDFFQLCKRLDVYKRQVRVNVLSEKYVPKGSESLFIRNIATTLMKNLESSWKEKTCLLYTSRCV